MRVDEGWWMAREVARAEREVVVVVVVVVVQSSDETRRDSVAHSVLPRLNSNHSIQHRPLRLLTLFCLISSISSFHPHLLLLLLLLVLLPPPTPRLAPPPASGPYPCMNVACPINQPLKTLEPSRKNGRAAVLDSQYATLSCRRAQAPP